uniref:G-protein coupled receptors family 1 profile domain-containing protein n=1 Tax=Salvator merianae TaxID=96440 RepID=A0A8D0B8L9_SALMN
MNSSRDAPFAGDRPWWAGGGVETGVVLPLLLAGVCLATLAANLLLLGVLVHQLRRGKLCSASALVLNLCSADLLLALYCAPPRIATYSRRSWLFGGFLCKTADWLLHGCLVAKSLTWAAVGQAHYRQALPSAKLCPGVRWWRLAGVAASVWLAALLLPLPQLIFTRLEAGSAPGLLRCVFQAPVYAANFMDVFAKVYPLLACLVPASFACSCCWRALRARKDHPKQHRLAPPGSPAGQKATLGLLALVLLFQAMWLPEWVVWLWEWHRSPQARRGTAPPPALVGTAEVLLFLNGSLSPAVLAATSAELRVGLLGVWTELRCRRGGAGGTGGSASSRAAETSQSLRELQEGEAAADKILPDVEHFWSDRRNTTAREESDPIPWERQDGP